MCNPEILDKGVDLCYSPDDGGFYLQKYACGLDHLTSQIFATRELALQAYRNGKGIAAIKWE
jgi:hypothetical protein